MRPTIICLPILITFCINNLFAQQIEWQNTIGGSGLDELKSISQTIDGGYILGGTSYSNISGDKSENAQGQADYWVIKIDSSGDIQWQNTIGGSGVDRLMCISQTSDDGYIVGGYSNSNISGDKTENSQGLDDYWVIKIDEVGNIQWQNSIGGNAYDNLYSISQTIDGGYILGGESSSTISGDKAENSYGQTDYWVIKLDSSGNIQWQNTIGGNYHDRLYSISQTLDGGYILGGHSASDISGVKTENSNGGFDYWVVKIDSIGFIQWQNTMGGLNNDILNSVSQTIDGGYILGGFSDSDISGDKSENSQGNTDYWIVKLDNVGFIQWQNTIGGQSYDELYSVTQTIDGGYIAGGYSYSNISGDKIENSQGSYDYWIVKLESSGFIQWQNTIGGSLGDKLFSIFQTTEGGYILGGLSQSDISGDKTENCQGNMDYWVIKLFPDTTTQLQMINIMPCKISIYPIVTTGVVYLDISSFMQKRLILDLYSSNGNFLSRIFNEEVNTINLKLNFDLSFLSSGNYYICIDQSNQNAIRFIKTE